MSVEAAFVAALRQLSVGATEPALLPDRLAQACVAALSVDGAGLSYTFTPGRRLPVGSSGATAAAAERLQFALGEGPCLLAQDSHGPVGAAMSELSGRWPVYAQQLAAHTPYRSVLAFPVAGPLTEVAAIDLYGCPPTDATAVTVQQMQSVAELVGEALSSAAADTEDRHLGVPGWVGARPAEDRQQVWRAVGYLTGQTGLASTDSLARLRAQAFLNDMDLETAATLVLQGELPAD